jgi:DNA-binding CsgD family transcriptional regulator
VLDQFSATIEKLYAAAADGTQWRQALIEVEDLTGSTGAVLDLIPKTAELAPRTLSGSFSEENCAEYARTYQAICPRIRFGVERSRGRTQVDYMFMSEHEMDRDPVYDWYGTHGLRYHIAGVSKCSGYIAAFSVQRTRRQGHANERDVALFDLLKPHLSRALSLADQLGTLRSFQRFNSALFQALPQAVFALDGGGIVLLANDAAERLIAACDGLGLEGGRLQATIPAERTSLENSIRSATVATGECSTGWTRVSRPSGRLPYAVFVAPLQVADEELLAARARALVVVHDPSTHQVPDLDVLKSVYALTDTEARLASAIGGGHSLESAAASLHMQLATARTHLKTIFTKLGVHRQQDLVRILTTLGSIAP